jgi:hypothetical protein
MPRKEPSKWVTVIHSRSVVGGVQAMRRRGKPQVRNQPPCSGVGTQLRDSSFSTVFSAVFAFMSGLVLFAD